MQAQTQELCWQIDAIAPPRLLLLMASARRHRDLRIDDSGSIICESNRPPELDRPCTEPSDAYVLVRSDLRSTFLAIKVAQIAQSRGSIRLAHAS